MAMTDDELKTAVLGEISMADGYDTGELAQMREDALDYYYNRSNIAPSAAGRSAVQSSDVADMVEAVMAQIMPSFEMERLVEFMPISEDDVDQAATESDAVNYMVMQENNGHYQIGNAVKDAVLMRNGFLKTFLRETVDVTTEKYEMLTELEFGQLKAASVDNLADVDNGISCTGEEDPPDSGFYSGTVKRKTTDRQVAVESVDPVNMSWYANWDTIYLRDCRFVSERSLPTRSELIEMGYPKSKVNALNAGAMNTSVGYQARNQTSQQDRYKAAEPSQDLIDFRENYIRIDRDGDGVAELLKVIIAGETLLQWEEAEYIPYASGTPFLQPHRFDGMGLYDKLHMLQDAKTSVLRQWLDNQNHANNARTSVNPNTTNMDDATNSRPGGIVRTTDPDGVRPFPFNDAGPSCQNTIGYLDQLRSERGGASLDLINAEAQIAGDTAHGVERQMTSKEMLAAMMTRTLADTLIRTTYEMVHQALRLYVPDQITFRRHGEFVTVNPAEWRERKRVVVTVGLSNSERMRRKGQLEQIILRQDNLMSNGLDGIMVTPDEIYNAQNDWSRVAGISTPEKYFRDPSSPEAQQAAQAKAQAAQQQQAYQERLLALQQSIEERKADNNDAKVIEDGRQADQQLQYEYWAKQQDVESKEAELIVDTATSVLKNEQATTSANDTGGESSTAAAR